MDEVPVIPIAPLQLRSVVSSRARGLVMTRLGTSDASAVSLAGH